MTHCEKCIHYEMCKWHENLIADTIVTFFPHNEDCSLFKNKADYAEVKHGEWLLIVEKSDYLEPPSCDTAKCSVCGRKIDVSETGFKYCPHCGAKMDGRMANEDSNQRDTTKQ